jgi:tripartite-type tricarboxylate transporter receptor subunit TctC
MQARLAAEGARFVPTTPQEFGTYVKNEIARWGPVVRASGARAD